MADRPQQNREDRMMWGVTKRAAVAAAVVVGAVWPAAAAAAPAEERAAAGETVCPDRNPEGSTPYRPVGTSAGQFAECTRGVPVLLDCPKGLLWNLRLNVCDWPWRAKETVAATETLLRPTPEGLSARVTWEGKPLYRAEVVITAPDGTEACSAWTDDTGRALCEDLDADGSGYTARYEGTEILTGSSATGAG
ncbi:carbohydrate-binding module family 14 protein [Streptomyces albidoflavus]